MQQQPTIKIGTRPSHDFKIWRSLNGQYYWVYYDGNYKALVTSETYTRYETAQAMLNNFKAEMVRYFNK